MRAMEAGVQLAVAVESAPAVRKERLIAAAMELFGKHGFAGTSVRDVAEAAGVKMGSIYNFFVDKRGLHVAVLEKAYGSLHEYVDGAKLTADDAAGNLRRVFAAVTRFFCEQPTAHRVILQELLVNAEHMDRAIELHLRGTRATINGVLRDGIACGVFREVDVEMFSYGLLSAMFGYFTSRALFLRLFAEKGAEKLFTKNMPFPLFEFALQTLCDVARGDQPALSRKKT
jgi:AcrR family transcriptional regulator